MIAGGKGADSTLRIKTPMSPRGAIRMRVVSGPDMGRETLVPPDMKRIAIGTRSESEVPLTDPTVSRRHAEIIPEKDRYLLRDLGSTNGTYIDNVRVEQAYVEPDSVIRVGRTEIRLLTSESGDATFGFEGLYGHSPVMMQVFELIEKVAASPLIVLIAGETGTGKELVARAIHRRSSRSAGPFTVVDCSAIPENLMESELFGHERGSFTGASSSRKGAFEVADRGT
ncbi:MAG TPA: FHA domain-containing protein, partial [Acidobacteriota bacterium]|nr:FHA domain-containing protein [Acidobacteriota bacterium]